ncbi:MAG: glycosyltransferase [Planctomycetes bacterium]|nr:glycosyltransferase [Planctomycetota bacterium]
MRIVLINQFYRPDTAATGQLLADIGAALVRRGHEVHAIASCGAYGGRKRFSAESVQSGVAVHRLGATGFGRAGLLGRALDYASFYVLAWRRAMQLPPMDACVCLTTPPLIGLIGSALKRRRRTRLILWPMDLYPDVMVAFGMITAGGTVDRLLTRMGRRLYARADAVIALGERMAEAEQKAGAASPTVVHNWVPGDVVAATEREPSEAVTWMYSGNLGLGHELETAIEAMATLRDLPSLQLRIVGEGKLESLLRQRVAQAGLASVTFEPPCPLERLSANLAVGDMHLVSQRPGTQGLLVPSKVYGILAAGRPAVYIGPDDTEVAEILRRSGAGVVCPPGDVDAVVEAVRRLTEDADCRQAMGRAGRQWYRQYLGRDRSVDRIVGIIESHGA